ncbi:MAG: hypothetical protein KME40_27820 [Komarekiella atlantica HA4396-MV6]|jgi:hypothetical protein|nr:hypothetical protein [Komarekiella atlantica HA4396-MV6]
MQRFLVAFGRLNWRLWIVALVLLASQPAWADTKPEKTQKVPLPRNNADIPQLSDIEFPQISLAPSCD